VNLDDLVGKIVVLDGGVLIGLALGERIFNKVKKYIMNELIDAVTHRLAIIELLYILCRRKSIEVAKKKLAYLIASGYISIMPLDIFTEEIAIIKCERRLSIADCCTLGIAQKLGGVALFAKLEKELAEEIKKKPFGCEIAMIKEDKIISK